MSTNGSSIDQEDCKQALQEGVGVEGWTWMQKGDLSSCQQCRKPDSSKSLNTQIVFDAVGENQSKTND